MKKYIFYIYGIFAAMLISCSAQKSVGMAEDVENAGTKTYCYADSCKHLILNMCLELPLGTDSASSQIRDSLIADFMRCAQQPWYAEEESPVAPFKGDMGNPQAIVDYYGKADYETLLKLATDDYKSRIEYLDEDTTMMEEERKEIMDDVPQWSLDLNVKKMRDTLDVVIYNSESYVYYGGAHGGVTGTGAITFDKLSGSKISRFLKSNATAALQPLLRKGLMQYYKDCGETLTEEELSGRVQVDGELIPLPQQTAFPTAAKDSLVLTYKQYEIACYADGMPSFRLAVKDIEKYLTEEGRKMLKKDTP